MKCKVCGGTGTSNTCVNGTFKPCTFCDGTGEFDPNEVDRFNAVDVIKVMEMVKKPMTNEEWFCGLTTEEKAKVMAEVSTRDSKITKRYYEYLLKEITEWLKAPHREEKHE